MFYFAFILFFSFIFVVHCGSFHLWSLIVFDLFNMFEILFIVSSVSIVGHRGGKDFALKIFLAKHELRTPLLEPLIFFVLSFDAFQGEHGLSTIMSSQ